MDPAALAAAEGYYWTSYDPGDAIRSVFKVFIPTHFDHTIAPPGCLTRIPTAVEVTGRPQETPMGDGSPLEEGATLHWWPIDALLEACRTGAVEDAKTEILVGRFLARG
jgi:hypothetical protein